MNDVGTTQTETLQLDYGVLVTFHGGVRPGFVEMPFIVKRKKHFIDIGDGGYGLATITYYPTVSAEAVNNAIKTVLHLLTIKYLKG